LEKRDKEGIPISLLKVSGPSEIAALSLTINKMIVGIRKSNTQLNDLKERLLLAWDGVNDGIWDWHIKNDKAYFSKNWKEILGYKEDELEDIPESFFNLLHDDDKILVQNHLERHFKDPEKNIYALEVRMRCKDGSYKWILTRGKANFDEHHNPIRMVGSHTD
ncbi:sensor domain-containing diguanylate cyclase, partial [Aliarcobacter trophiarum LMG 25534]